LTEAQVKIDDGDRIYCRKCAPKAAETVETVERGDFYQTVPTIGFEPHHGGWTTTAIIGVSETDYHAGQDDDGVTSCLLQISEPDPAIGTIVCVYLTDAQTRKLAETLLAFLKAS
jgi:hypothetical protein